MLNFTSRVKVYAYLTTAEIVKTILPLSVQESYNLAEQAYIRKSRHVTIKIPGYEQVKAEREEKIKEAPGLNQIARAKAMLELRRANSWLFFKDKEDFGWNQAKLLLVVAFSERVTLKLDKIQDIKCKMHDYREQIYGLLKVLPERLQNSKVSMIYDSAPNRCR